MSHLLEVKNLTTAFTGDYGRNISVDHVSFHVDPGEVVCIVGESGCGKSVTSLSIMGLLGRGGEVTEGSVRFDGKELLSMSEKELDQIRGNEMTMIFQDPLTSLNPTFTIGSQMMESIRIHMKLSKSEAAARAEALLRRVGMPDPKAVMKKYPHTLSGGMRQRVMIAMALCCDPRLLIADEPTTALDVTIQAQIMQLLVELQKETHMAMILITHDIGLVANMADRVLVMYAGQLIEAAPSKKLFAQPEHPYTRALLDTVPTIRDDASRRLVSIPGIVPEHYDNITGCRFAARCTFACEACKEVRDLYPFGEAHAARCVVAHRAWEENKKIFESADQFEENEEANHSELAETSAGIEASAEEKRKAAEKKKISLKEKITEISDQTGPADREKIKASEDRGAVTSLRAENPAEKSENKNPRRVLVEVDHLKKYYPIKGGIITHTVGNIHAVDDVSLSIFEGETLGLVGESGCGKSTIGRQLVGLETPTSGVIRYEGQDLAAKKKSEMKQIRTQLQMVFQDPYSSLNPRKHIYEILAQPMLYHHISTKDTIDRDLSRLLDMVGLPRHILGRYPHEFSGGQRQRIGIARALSLNPKFIVCDEPVSALDVSIQAQILNLLKGLQKELNLTLLFVGHGLGAVNYVSDRIAVMYLGRIVEIGDAKEVFHHPLHPYTQALLEAVPVPDPQEKEKQRSLLSGEIGNSANPPKGCRFHPRCPYATKECAQAEPALMKITDSGHYAACPAAEKYGEKKEGAAHV